MQRSMLVLVVPAVLAVGASPALAQVTLRSAPATVAVVEQETELEAAPRERDHGLRARYGLSIGALAGGGDSLRRAAFGSNESVAPAFGGELQGRIGVQIEDHIAVFYQGTFAAGHEVPICIHLYGGGGPCPASDDALYLHASSLVVDVTFLRGMQIGVGGSVVAALFDTALPSTEIHYGWLARIGYAFGGDGPGERRGFTIGLQANISVATGNSPGPLVDIALSLGWESF